MKEKELKEFISKGHILCKVIFEMAGNPKEHVEQTLKKYIDAVKEDPSYIFMNEYFAPCEEGEDGIWSTFYESDVLAENFEKLNVLCFNLSPASIEIIEPEEFHLTQKNVTDWYNDLISRLHEVSIGYKNLTAENQLLKVNINALIKNAISLSLSEPRNAEDISQRTGIDKEHLEQFLENMIKEKIISKNGQSYVLNK